MSFLVSTAIADVPLVDLGITVVHPTTDRDLSLEFSSVELANSNNLLVAIQSESLILKIVSDDYGEYVVDPTEYYAGFSVQNAFLRAEIEQYISHQELGAGNLNQLVDSGAFNLAITSTAALTQNVYVSSATFQKWLVAPGDEVVLVSSPASGIYTVDEVVDQTQFTVIEAIPDTAGVGTLSIYHPPGATLVGVDDSEFVSISGVNLQTVLNSIDFQIGQTSGFTSEIHKSLLQLIHFIDEGPAKGFVSGATKTVTGGLFPTLIEWRRQDSTLLLRKTITRSGGGATNVSPTPVLWQLFDSDGTTILETVSDAITYSGIIETSRVRTIS